MNDELTSRRTVVLLPAIAAAKARTPLRLLGVRGQLVPLTGALALILGRDVADETLCQLSSAFRRVELPVVQVTGGMLQVRTARRGRLSDPVSAGVAAQSWPDQVLGLVFGTVDPASLPGAVDLDTGGGGQTVEGGRGRPGLIARLLGRGTEDHPRQHDPDQHDPDQHDPDRHDPDQRDPGQDGPPEEEKQ